MDKEFNEALTEIIKFGKVPVRFRETIHAEIVDEIHRWRRRDQKQKETWRKIYAELKEKEDSSNP